MFSRLSQPADPQFDGYHITYTNYTYADFPMLAKYPIYHSPAVVKNKTYRKFYFDRNGHITNIVEFANNVIFAFQQLGNPDLLQIPQFREVIENGSVHNVSEANQVLNRITRPWTCMFYGYKDRLRKLRLQHHPDKHHLGEIAHHRKRFEEVTAADEFIRAFIGNPDGFSIHPSYPGSWLHLHWKNNQQCKTTWGYGASDMLLLQYSCRLMDIINPGANPFQEGFRVFRDLRAKQEAAERIKEENQKVQAQLEAQEKELLELKNLKEAKTRAITGQSDEVARLRQELKDQDKELDALREQVTSQAGRVQELTAEVRQLQGFRTQLAALEESGTTNRDTLAAEVRDLQSKNQQLESEISGWEMRHKTLETQHREFKTTIERLSRRDAKLKRKLAQMTETKRKQKADLKATQRQVRQLEEAEDKRQRKRDREDARVESQLEKNAQKRARLAGLPEEKQRQALTRDIATIRRQNESLICKDASGNHIKTSNGEEFYDVLKFYTQVGMSRETRNQWATKLNQLQKKYAEASHLYPQLINWRVTKGRRNSKLLAKLSDFQRIHDYCRRLKNSKATAYYNRYYTISQQLSQESSDRIKDAIYHIKK